MTCRCVLLAALIAFAQMGCGGPPKPKTVDTSVKSLDVASMLLEHAAGHSRSLLRPAAASPELEVERKQARGKERHELIRKLAIAHMHEAEEALGLKEKRRHQRAAIKQAAAAAKVMKGPWDRAELAFIRMWTIYRMGRPSADKVVSHFIKRHRVSAELVVVAWLIRAELDYEKRRWKKAERSYRYVVAMAPHPLYGLALYRTAQCYDKLGRTEDVSAAFSEIVQLGCAEEVRSVSDEVLSSAAAQQREELVRTPEGKLFPARCVPEPEPEAEAG